MEFGGIITALLLLFSQATGLPEKQFYCLSEAIYFEARGEAIEGQIGVGKVILNRRQSAYFPDTVCSVVHQAERRNDKIVRNRCQFSYYCDGKKETILNTKSFLIAMTAVFLSIKIKQPLIEGALFYHTTEVNPYWNNYKKRLGVIGRHAFYK